jgi:condensin complex subunit 1
VIKFNISSSDEIVKLHLINRFKADAVRFIHQIHTAIPALCQLLAFATNSEVIEVIEFFETAQL